MSVGVGFRDTSGACRRLHKALDTDVGDVRHGQLEMEIRDIKASEYITCGKKVHLAGTQRFSIDKLFLRYDPRYLPNVISTHPPSHQPISIYSSSSSASSLTTLKNRSS